MRPVEWVRLLALAAIWGGAFVFYRVLAPVLGLVLTADLRVLIAGAVLVVYYRIIRFDLEWHRFWKQYIIIGLVNSGLPFLLYSFAAFHLPASYIVILNSSSPLFGAVFSAIWLGEKLSMTKIIGLLLGSSGVALLGRARGFDPGPLFGWAVAACLLAAVCYAWSGIYIKKSAANAKPMAIAGASQLVAGLFLLPLVPFDLPKGPITIWVIINVLIFALICSAVAYLLYYRLIADVGPAKALTVTFLMPLFGMLWGYWFLREVITIRMMAGCLLIVLGTVLVVRPKPALPVPAS